MDGEGLVNGEGDERRRKPHASTNGDPDNSQSSSTSSSNTNATNPEASGGSSLTSPNSEYCKQLETWLWKCYWHRTLAISAYFTALNQQYVGGPGPELGSRTQQQQGRQQLPPGLRINFNVFANQANNQQQRTGTQLALVKIAPIWKRLLAELIDFVILMIVKLIVTFSIVDNFDIIDFDNIDLSSFQQQDAEIRISSLYDLAFTLSSELLILELIHRLIACIVEGYCLSKSGCTPGKSLLNLRVIYAESISNAGNQAAADIQYVLVSPGSYLTFPRAFFRSAVKNFSLAFFFPLCFTLFHFDYSRTLYDMLGKSLVIENN